MTWQRKLDIGVIVEPTPPQNADQSKCGLKQQVLIHDSQSYPPNLVLVAQLFIPNEIGGTAAQPPSCLRLALEDNVSVMPSFDLGQSIPPDTAHVSLSSTPSLT